MSRPETTEGSVKRGRRRLWRGLAVVVAVLVVAAGAGIWWFLRDDAPSAVSLDAAAASLEDDTAATTAAGSAGARSGSAQTGSTSIAGMWTVDTSVGEFSFEDSTGTFVGFRVKEELSGIGSTTAVGRTPKVSGTLTVEGDTATVVSIEADLSALTTNESRRDDRARSALGTNQFPTASFVLKEPIKLGEAAAAGEAVSVTATGDLTVHGVTKRVQFPLQAQLKGDTIVVVGSLDIAFADYGVSVPTAPVVVSAEDHGPIELQLFFARG